MVNVQPFRGLRYDADIVGDWGAVLGPPYDIVDAAQTANLKASSPHQIAHIETASGDDINNAAQLLKDWRQSGAIIQDEAPSFYLHEHRFGDGQVRRAIFGAVELTPWGEAGVMAHERTMPGPKATRTALRSVVGADISPLMAFVPDADGALADSSQKPPVSQSSTREPTPPATPTPCAESTTPTASHKSRTPSPTTASTWPTGTTATNPPSPRSMSAPAPEAC